MATTTAGQKRKGKNLPAEAKPNKKPKADKSADRPLPLKSALKKTSNPVKSTAPKSVKTKEAKPVSKKADDQIALDLSDDEDGNTELTPDQTAALLAGFSSDEEEDVPSDSDAIPVSKIPLAPSTGLIQKRIRLAIEEQDDPETTPGVLYIGRLPHGFYEHQLKAYLTQFGELLNLRLARNKKTGKSQHYAFVEFASAAVAEIVAKTMDKYLLFNHLLQVRRVPKEQIKENMFAGSGKRFKKAPPRNKMERGSLKRGMVREGWEKRVEREEKKRIAKAEVLKELGYEFDMPAVKQVSDVPVKEKEVVQEAIENGAEDVEDAKALPVTEETAEDKEAPKPSRKRTSAAVESKKTRSKAKKVKA